MPKTRKYVAYYRCSTERQNRSGLGLDAQKAAVRVYLSGIDGQLVEEIVEVESGRRADRPQLEEALRLCRLHKAVLVLAKMDRLARSVAFVSGLMESGVEFTAVDFPAANRLTVHILSAVAEHEAHACSERTIAALAAAKARGVRLGGDRGKLAHTRHLGTAASAVVRSQRAQSRAEDIAPMVHGLRANGLSLRQVAAELTGKGIPTPGGHLEWGQTQVKRVLDRVEVNEQRGPHCCDPLVPTRGEQP